MNTAMDSGLFKRYFSIGILVFLAIILVLTSLKIFLVLFAACLFAVFLFSIAEFIQGYIPPSYKASLALGISVLLVLFVLFMAYLYPKISGQISEFMTKLPDLLDQFRAAINNYFGPGVNVKQWIDQNTVMLQDVSQQALQSVAIVFSALGTFIVIMFLGVFLALEPDLYRSGFLSLIVPDRRAETYELVKKVVHNLQWWLIGRLCSMVLVGILTTIGLVLLNVPMAYGIGFLTALLDFIPFVGPVLAAIPAILMSSTQGGQSVLYVILLYSVVQFIEGYILTPLIQRKAASLPPALTLFVIFMLGYYGGLLGTALAAPLTVMLMVIIKEAYVKMILERKPALKPQHAQTHEEGRYGYRKKLRVKPLPSKLQPSAET